MKAELLDFFNILSFQGLLYFQWLQSNDFRFLLATCAKFLFNDDYQEVKYPKFKILIRKCSRSLYKIILWK